MTTPKILHNKWIWITGGALLLLLIVYVAARAAGRKSAETPLPNMGAGIPSVVDEATGQIIYTWQPTEVLAVVYDAISGWNWSWATGNTALVNATGMLLALTDDQLVMAYNVWNDSYGLEWGETLTQSLNAEWWEEGSQAAINMALLNSRFWELGLT